MMSSRICARRRRPSTAISAWSSWASCLFPLFRAPSWVSEARGGEEGGYGRPGDESDQCYCCSSPEVQSIILSLSGPRSVRSGSGGWTVRPKARASAINQRKGRLRKKLMKNYAIASSGFDGEERGNAGTMTTSGVWPAAGVSIKKSCDFCVKRKRRCDGRGTQRCSFCIAKNRPECRYSSRLPPWPVKASAKQPSTTATTDVARWLSPTEGRSFWQTEDERADNAAKAATAAQGKRRRKGSGAEGAGWSTGLPLPLKRGRFSASRATGLIGLQENRFLADFFECLGFLSLATESTVRDALFSVMLAAVQREEEAAPAFAPARVEDDRYCSGGNGRLLGSSTTPRAEGKWSESEAVAAENRALPRNPRTCILWCAIALGALVRGCPSVDVEQYVSLAENSLAACCGSTTIDTARSYIATAILHNFLGNQRKNHGYVKAAEIIVNSLPPEDLPTGIHQVLLWAGKAWVFERELASAEETEGYWENATPIWKLSDSVGEHDICSLILSVDVRVDQAIFEGSGAERVFLVEQEQQHRKQPTGPVPAVTNRLPRRDHAGAKVERWADSRGVPKPTAEAGHAPSSSARASAGMCKEALPEMSRLRHSFESSKMRLGLGGLIYYMRLGYLQSVNNLIARSADSFERALGPILRFPGVCRSTCWSHFVHFQLWRLSFGPGRERYEELRAAYNPVRPAGTLPAPPFEEWRGMSDICDHAYCRRTNTQSDHIVDLVV